MSVEIIHVNKALYANGIGHELPNVKRSEEQEKQQSESGEPDRDLIKSENISRSRIHTWIHSDPR